MKLFTARDMTRRKNYRSDRMSRIRCEVSRWMQEYEGAKTAKHREVCMDMIQRNLKQYEWYGHR
jgi:hypothetical protein